MKEFVIDIKTLKGNTIEFNFNAEDITDAHFKACEIVDLNKHIFDFWHCLREKESKYKINEIVYIRCFNSNGIISEIADDTVLDWDYKVKYYNSNIQKIVERKLHDFEISKIGKEGNE